MTTFRFQTGVSLVLSALMLTGGVAPLGIRHAHAEGGKRHRHEGEQTASSHEDHAHHSESHTHHDAQLPAHKPGCGCSSIADAISHIHVTLLGVDFVLPTSDTPDNQQNDDLSDSVVVWLCGESYTGQLTQQNPRELLPLHARTLDLENVERFVRFISGSPPVTSQPLCDSARLERTGVRLI